MGLHADVLLYRPTHRPPVICFVAVWRSESFILFNLEAVLTACVRVHVCAVPSLLTPRDLLVTSPLEMRSVSLCRAYSGSAARLPLYTKMASSTTGACRKKSRDGLKSKRKSDRAVTRTVVIWPLSTWNMLSRNFRMKATDRPRAAGSGAGEKMGIGGSWEWIRLNPIDVSYCGRDEWTIWNGWG